MTRGCYYLSLPIIATSSSLALIVFLFGALPNAPSRDIVLQLNFTEGSSAASTGDIDGFFSVSLKIVNLWLERPDYAPEYLTV